MALIRRLAVVKLAAYNNSMDMDMDMMSFGLMAVRR